MSAEGILCNPGLFHNMLAHLPVRAGLNVTNADATKTTVPAVDIVNVARSCAEGRPSLLALYREYCALSKEYAVLGGWEQLNRHYRQSRGVTAFVSSAADVTPSALETCSGGALGVYEGAACRGTEAAAAAASSSGSAVVAAISSTSSGSSNVLADDSNSAGSKRNHAVANNTTYIPEPRQLYIARQHLAWMLGKSGHGRMVRYVHIGAYYKKHVHLMQAMNDAGSIDDLLAIAENCLPN
jgi:hypothetical protein